MTGTDGGARSTFSSVWFDANNDQRPDLYVIHEYGNGLLLVNQPDGTFKSRNLLIGRRILGRWGCPVGISIMTVASICMLLACIQVWQPRDRQPEKERVQ